MGKMSRKPVFCLVSLFLVLLPIACSVSSPEELSIGAEMTARPLVATWQAGAPEPTPLATPPPVAMPVPVATPTPTPQPSLPVPAGEPLPPSPFPITGANADRVVQLARWGDGTVRGVAWSADGRLLMLISSLGVYLYDAETMERVGFVAMDLGAEAVAISPDGRVLAAASGGTIRLWWVTGGVPLYTLGGHISPIYDLAFSPDGSLLASTSRDNTVRLWRVADGVLLWTWSGPEGSMRLVGDSLTGSEMRDVVFSPDGAYVAARSLRQYVVLLRTSDGALLHTLRSRDEGFNDWGSLAISPDGEVLALGSGPFFGGRISFWRVPDGTLLETLDEAGDDVAGLAFSPDGGLLASGNYSGTIYLRQLPEADPVLAIEGYGDLVKELVFSPNGEMLASLDVSGVPRLWRVADGSPVEIPDVFWGEVQDVGVSPDGQMVAVAAGSGDVPLLRTMDGVPLYTLRGHTDAVLSVAFSPDGALLASGSDDQTVRLWNLADGTLRSVLTGHTNRVWDVAFSPDGEVLAAAGDSERGVWLWRVEDGTVLDVLSTEQMGWVSDLSLSPDGEMLASVERFSRDVLQLWSVTDRDLLRTVEEVQEIEDVIAGARFDPQGRWLVGSGSTLWVWRLPDLSPLYTAEGYGHVGSMALSPNGQVVALGMGNRIVLWRLSDGAFVRTLEGHSGRITGLAFSADGSLLVSSSLDGTVRLWGVVPGVAAPVPTPTPVSGALQGLAAIQPPPATPVHYYCYVVGTTTVTCTIGGTPWVPPLP